MEDIDAEIIPNAPSSELLRDRRHSEMSFLHERSEYKVSFLHPDERPPAKVAVGVWEKKVKKYQRRCQSYSWIDWLGYFLPCVAWIKTYNVREWLFWDFLAGLSVAFMVIPQGMSYANLANLPAIFGLYGAFVPTLVYGIFGTCGQLAVGPVAVTSLLLGSGLQNLFNGQVNSSPNSPADPCLQDQYNRAAVQIAFMAGLIYSAVGFLGMGWIVNFLSRSVISGFMTAAATIILLGQVKYILGVTVAKVDPVQDQLTNLVNAVKVPGAFLWREFVMGGFFIVFLLFLRWAGNRTFRGYRLVLLGAMGPLLVTIIGTASMNIFKWYEVFPITSTTTTAVVKNVTNSTALTLAAYCSTILNSTNVTAAALSMNTTLYTPSNCTSNSTKTSSTTNSTSNSTKANTTTTSSTSSNGTNSCASAMYTCLNGNLSCFQQAKTTFAATTCVSNITGCVTTATACLTASTCVIKVPKANKTTNPLIKPVGAIPQGMPNFTAGWFFPMSNFGSEIVLAIIICMVDICESISIAKAMALRRHYEIDGGKELRGLGIANVLGSLFNCYTTTGSFSRSSVSFSVGSHTPLASFITGMVMLFVLLFLTPLFTNMPQNVQGAIIIVAVLGLMDFGEAWFLFKVSKVDFLVWLVAWLCTMFLGVEIGIGISVGCSILLLVMHTAFPTVRMLGCLPNTAMYRCIKQYPEAKPVDGILILRVDAPLYFANVQYVKEWIRRRLRKCQERNLSPPISFVIIDLSAVSVMDATAIHFFLDLIFTMKQQKISMQLVNPTWKVLQVLKDSGVLEQLDENAVHVVTHDAVLYAKDLLSSEASSRSIRSTPDCQPAATPSLEQHNESNDVIVEPAVGTVEIITEGTPPPSIAGSPIVSGAF